MRYFLSLFVVFLIYNVPVSAEQKIVFVDMDKLVSVSKPGSSIFNQLKDINQKNLNFLKEEEKRFKEIEKKLIAQKNIISEADFENKIKELKSEVNSYNQNRSNMIEKFNKLKVDNTNKLLKLINPILTKFSNDNDISIILQKKNLIIGKTELDITDEVIKIINSEIKDFKINYYLTPNIICTMPKCHKIAKIIRLNKKFHISLTPIHLMHCLILRCVIRYDHLLL